MTEKIFRHIILFSWFISTAIISPAQPAGYYSPATGLNGIQLRQALHDIIDNQTTVTYTSLWTYFQSTDRKSDGKVWDMYSDNPSGTPVYSYIFVTDQCGNYSAEGDCYNREHSFPNSWFGGEVYPMYTDLFHLYPTDGYVNNKRGNYPFGQTSSPTWTSANGSKVGTSSFPGYTGIVFEPINTYKGDFARTFFYMATRYFGEDSGWPGSDMVTGSQPKEWALRMLMEWDQSDPVSQKEKERNEAVYTIQENRNPFIDNPLFAGLIWGTQSSINDLKLKSGLLKIWPNPAKEKINLELPDGFSGNFELKIFDASGKILSEKLMESQNPEFDVSALNTGFYIILVSGSRNVLSARLIISR